MTNPPHLRTYPYAEFSVLGESSISSSLIPDQLRLREAGLDTSEGCNGSQNSFHPIALLRELDIQRDEIKMRNVNHARCVNDVLLKTRINEKTAVLSRG